MRGVLYFAGPKPFSELSAERGLDLPGPRNPTLQRNGLSGLIKYGGKILIVLLRFVVNFF